MEEEGEEGLTGLSPELDVLDANGDQLVVGVRVPADHEQLVLVPTSGG